MMGARGVGDQQQNRSGEEKLGCKGVLGKKPEKEGPPIGGEAGGRGVRPYKRREKWSLARRKTVRRKKNIWTFKEVRGVQKGGEKNGELVTIKSENGGKFGPKKLSP